MRKIGLSVAVASVAAIFAVSAADADANPLVGALSSNAVHDASLEGLVLNVHGWHCGKRFSRSRGWHRHRRACFRRYYYYPYYFYDYPVYGPKYDQGPLRRWSNPGDRHKRHYGD
jgi:hypothetical protein